MNVNTDNETEAKIQGWIIKRKGINKETLYKTLEQQGVHLKAYRSVQWPET